MTRMTLAILVVLTSAAFASAQSPDSNSPHAKTLREFIRLLERQDANVAEESKGILR